MGEFVKRRRRIIGWIMLVIACSFAACWWRSSMTGDYLSLAIGSTKIAILSQQGVISTAVFPTSTDPKATDPQTGWWRIKLSGAEVKFVHYNIGLPYWSIVISLALSSAWLLLKTPEIPIENPIANNSNKSSSRKKPNRRSKRSR